MLFFGSTYKAINSMQDLFHSKITLGCIHYVSYRGGQRILGGVLKFLEQKRGDIKIV